MNDNIFKLVAASRVFSSLDAHASKLLIAKLSEVSLVQTEVLFYQGDPSDSVFLLISGKLSAELTSVSGETRIVGHIEPGETVGELGALSSEPRSLTVKALKDAKLLRLSAKDFIEICHQHASVMFATMHPIIMRSTSILQMLSTKKLNKHIVIVPANKDVILQPFAEKLMHAVQSFSSIVCVSDYQNDFSSLNDLQAISKKVQTLTQTKKSPYKILYILKSYDTPLAKFAFKKADSIYIAALHDSTPTIASMLQDKIVARRSHLYANPDLILIHPPFATQPRATRVWLAQIDFTLHHHVRLDNAGDFQRLIRFIREKAVGLVLGGGGTRGFAHLGVIKALQESNVPIDMIGGTSAGAIAGACFALHQSYEEAHEKFSNMVTGSRHSISWRSLTWPVISLFNADAFTQSQIDAFGQVQIEDMWLPFFCVSCNLTKQTEVIHRSGTLWEKTRASSSIPGIIPPMMLNGEIHLDGGLLNNLPVDAMRQFIGNKGKIIAVELNSFSAHLRKYNFPPILTFKEILLAKLGWGNNKYKFPRFIDTFLRGMFVGSTARSKQNSLAANIFISLNLSKFRLLHVSTKQAESLVEIGYAETRKQILGEKE